MTDQKGGPAEYKTFPSIALKFDEDKGIVDHVITVFGVLDHVKDISHPGSFKKTIQERQSKVRVLDMHRADSIMRVIAKPLTLREVGRDELPREVLDKHPEATGGVMASTKFLMDTPEGKGAFIRLKEGAVDEWSYGYDPLDVDYSTVKQDGEDVKVRNLRQIRLYEYGPVLWGANPATVTLSAKTKDGEPDEEKPAPDVTENTIRIRVRDPGDFQDDSFRTINIGGGDTGIKATVGRLRGENTMTVQSYVFDKEKFSVEEAQAWVDEHKKDAIPDLDEKQATEDGAEAVTPTEQDEGPYRCECLECGHVMESEKHCRDIKCPKCGGEMRRAERPGPGQKENESEGETKGVSGKTDWPLASRDRAWDNSAAEGRIRVWAGAEDGPNKKYRSCHFWYDAENADNFTAYKLLFCDVADGQVHAIPRGIFAVAAVLRGARGGANIPAGDQAAVKGRVSGYYAKMREKFDDDSIVVPWEKAAEPAPEAKGTPEEVVLASVILQNVMMRLDEGSWERQAAELAVGKLRTLYGEGLDNDEVAEMERKAGRVLAARNAARVAAALTSLIEVLEDAGVDIPGYGKEPSPPKSPKEEEEEKDLRLELDVLGAELEMLEME